MNQIAAPTLDLALLGSRGMGRYGGYETLMAELAPRLVARGHRVTVFSRAHYTPPGVTEERGVTLRVLPTVRTRHLDTPVHTLLSAADVAFSPTGGRFDAALVVNGANALFVPLLSLAGVPTALHVDGIERQRSKWGMVGRTVYALSERLACVVPDALVTDAEVIRRYYLERYGTPSVPITYGVAPEPLPPGETLARLGLEPRRYVLYVSRFEPENNPHRVVEAYARVGGDLPLVMVGGAPYATGFIEDFQARADDRVLFPGPIYGEGYRELLSHAAAYVQATEVGGTHPALVEAMGYGNCVLVNDTPENTEVAGPVGRTFEASRPETLARRIEEVLADPQAARAAGEAAAARARRLFSWDAVTDRYESLFRSLAAGAAPVADPSDPSDPPGPPAG